MMTSCPNCAQDEPIPDHSSTLWRTMTESVCDCMISTSAHFHVFWSRPENPGVGGSIPSLPTTKSGRVTLEVQGVARPFQFLPSDSDRSAGQIGSELCHYFVAAPLVERVSAT